MIVVYRNIRFGRIRILSDSNNFRFLFQSFAVRLWKYETYINLSSLLLFSLSSKYLHCLSSQSHPSLSSLYNMSLSSLTDPSLSRTHLTCFALSPFILSLYIYKSGCIVRRLHTNHMFSPNASQFKQVLSTTTLDTPKP